MISVAERYFDLSLDERCTVSLSDACDFVERSAKGSLEQTWDLIVVDCFGSEGLASGVAGGTLLRQLDACLSPRGLAIVNTTWGGTAGARGETASRLAAVLSE